MVETPTDPSRGTVADPRFAYILDDDQMAQGSTLGAPRCTVILKPTGSIATIYSPDAGFCYFGAIGISFWDRRSKLRLSRRSGEFHIHPERQDYVYQLDNGVRVHEQVFPYNDDGKNGNAAPPPAVYYRVHLTNATSVPVSFDLYGFCELRGNTSQDVESEYDEALGGIVVWNRSTPAHVRLFATLAPSTSWETNADR